MKDIDNKLVENRRAFLKKASMIIGAGIVIPAMGSVICSCEKNEALPVMPLENITIPLSSYSTLANVGGSAKVTITGKNGGMPIIIIKKSATEFVVVNSKCTHDGAEVDLPEKDGNKIHCSRHGVDFNKLDGSILNNPISGWKGKPLPTYANTYNASANTLDILI